MLLGFLFPLYGFSHADEGVKKPYELVRSLRVLQDQIADGSSSAHGAQRQLMVQIAERLARVEPEEWKDGRNLRAAVVFVLSGGSPQILRRLLSLDVVSKDYDSLVKGALAYGEGRAAPAEKFLGEVDARKLQESLAGQVALSQAVLVASENPDKAIKLLDEARLYAPGSLVEESALRREALLLAASGDLHRFEYIVSAYVRRFPRSLYSPAFFRQLAVSVANQKKYASTPELLKGLEGTLTGLDRDERREVYLAMSEEAVQAGNITVAIFSAGNAAKLVDKGSQPFIRAQLYEGAALLVTDDYGRGIEQLKTIDRTKLNLRDAKLLDVALLMASKLRWPPEPPSATASEPAISGEGADKDEVNGVALGRKARVKARRALDEVDKLFEQKKIGGGKK
jgi:chemotaxis protein MotC